MIVRLYNFSKKLNSTARPSGGASYECALKKDSSKRNPYIEITGTDPTWTPAGYNYAYIPLYDRYYYVDNWTWVLGVWGADLSVDVLASYRDDIGATSLYVLRSSVEYDNRILDTFYPAKAGVADEITELSNPFTTSYSNGSYVVGVVSKSAASGAVAYYVLSYSQMATFRNYMMSQSNLPAWNADWSVNFPELNGEAIKALINPFQYVASCMWLPFAMYSGGSASMDFGYWDSGLSFPTLSANVWIHQMQVSVPDNFIGDPDEWRRQSPYASYQLVAPPFGAIDLDASYMCREGQLSLQIYVDPISGVGRLNVWGSSTGHLYASVSAMVGVNVQLAQLSTDAFNVASVTAGTVGGIVKSALSGDIAGAITGAVSGVGDIAKSQMPTLSTLGGNGGTGSLAGRWRFTTLFRDVVEYDNDTFGRPLCKVKTPSGLGGFIMAKYGDKVACSGTKEEKEEIRSFLEGGFYYE